MIDSLLTIAAPRVRVRQSESDSVVRDREEGVAKKLGGKGPVRRQKVGGRRLRANRASEPRCDLPAASASWGSSVSKYVLRDGDADVCRMPYAVDA